MDQIIEILKYMFLGAVQGITETLPISSSGHLVLSQELIGIGGDKNLTFEILLHFGSLIAILFFYRKLIIELVTNFFIYLFKRDEDKRADFIFCWLLVVATIPAGLFGFFFNDFIGENLTNTFTVGISLLVTAAILYIISKMPKGHKQQKDVTIVDALWIGFMQAMAIIPGISRSGSTVSMSLARKLSIDTALRFSFLLFIPVALGAALLDVVDLVQQPNLGDIALPYFLAFITSIIFTFISLKIFIDILKKGKLHYFAYYCLFAGTTSLVLYFVM